MERLPRSREEADKLLLLADLLRDQALIVKEEWAKEDFSGPAFNDTARILPSVRLWEATKTIETISGGLVELVCEPNQRVQVPDLLAEAGDQGLDIDVLAAKTGIEASKLSRVTRTLCATHIFKETNDSRFANNRVSEALVRNEGLRAYVQLFNLHVYRASEYLPKYLVGTKGASFDVCDTPLQDALGIDVPLWEWMAKKVPIDQIQSNGPGYPSVPDVSNCTLTPDEEGGFVLQLLPVYPQLKFVVQDRLENVKQGEEEIFPREAPDAIPSGRVKFMAHEFFQENPVKGADVYWLRGVL
ncbi:MAG: hypothetical protein Q9221_004688 [Calogaya cf. arnoldii]